MADLRTMYPGWPDISPKEVGDPAHRKILIFVQNLKDFVESSQARGRRPVNQSRLAETVKVNKGTVSRVLTGRLSPTAEFIARSEAYVGLDLWPSKDALWDLTHGG